MPPRRAARPRGRSRVARPWVEVPVDVARPGPRRESPLDRARVEPLEPVPEPRQRPVAVALERALAQRLAREQQEPDLVVHRLVEPRVPRAPAVDRALGQAGVELVRAVVHAHGLVDVGRRRLGVRRGAGLDDTHRVLPRAQLERRRQTDRPGPDDHDRARGPAHLAARSRALPSRGRRRSSWATPAGTRGGAPRGTTHTGRTGSSASRLLIMVYHLLDMKTEDCFQFSRIPISTCFQVGNMLHELIGCLKTDLL